MTSFPLTYDETIRDLEAKLSALIDDGATFDFTRSGDVLTIEFDDGEKIVITPQAPMQQLWISANYAGYRFHWSEQSGSWIDEKSGEKLYAFLSKAISSKLGEALNIS